MDSKFTIQSPDDFEKFVPRALADFNLTPSCVRLTGEKHLDGTMDFVYTLKWSLKADKEVISSKKKIKRSAKLKEKKKEKKTFPRNKFGIIGPYDDIPLMLEVKEVDGRTYHIVEDEDCAFRLEGNVQFSLLMRAIAIEMGVYKATALTPRQAEYDLATNPIIIRKRFFDELMKFREEGKAYRGPWKGFIDHSHPKVDYNDSQWLNDHPFLWPKCKLIRPEKDSASSNSIWSEYYSNSEDLRRYELDKKESKAARRKWLTEWRKFIEKKADSWPVILSLFLLTNKEAEKNKKIEIKLMITASSDEPIKPVIKRMIKEAKLKQLPADETVFSNLFVKTRSGKKCHLRNVNDLQLGDLKRVKNEWRFFLTLK